MGHPEMSKLTLTENHAFLVIATDGVWEFLSSQSVVDIVRLRPAPQSLKPGPEHRASAAVPWLVVWVAGAASFRVGHARLAGCYWFRM